MAECTNLEWFDLAGSEDHWTLTDLGRLQCITNSLPNPEQQCPSLLVFVGKQLKSTLLQDVYAGNHVTRRKTHGIANLLIDLDTRTLSSPILFADCTPEAPCTNPRDPWYACHETHRHTICGERMSQTALVSRTHVNLLFPFTHVVCVFADDLGGNRACAAYIEHWMNQHRGATGGAVQACPHLLVTTTCLEDLDLLVQVECQASFDSVFESYQVLTVGHDPAAGSDSFERTLKRLISDSRRLRRQHHVLLNGVDLARMFARATEVFSENTRHPADLLACSRHPARLLSVADVAHHLLHLRSLTVNLVPESVLTELTASAFLVQGYPPGFHRE